VKNDRVRLPDEFVDHVKRTIGARFDVGALDVTALRAAFEAILPE